ncbi:hypothetical protein TREMEDRAFT_69401 [Tremella mesenterica DSM 1558]|uniref:uncharacterized protein n=1 Tax=Tremella mesenterica (strain ATCC 24925 / CBS 8224 / DSM 1558 / NBRC 9311 / NRRL Y-6157 / RJB 2259-6 / UBC 559-6) TaxID=578456 RepID=UPI0003F4A0B0|nr:uncharacterized protein TREMEDRAFT_69401 [Tremella mesenterica DSM 1558]EIW68505.1 hypothetical protein TREMEDRAFT_69401 [Tremella mesenterica DSM 1558]
MSFPGHTSTLIIGGGPAGLVSLKYVLEYGPRWDEGEAPVLVEMEPEIGGTFRWRGYENAELVSSRQLTCFSDLRYPSDTLDHPSLVNFVEYLEAYAHHFKLFNHIHLSTKVVSLSLTHSSDDYRHCATVLRTSRESKETTKSTILAKRVIITTGLHVTPNIPPIPGLTVHPTSNTPKWFHSSSYKTPSQTSQKKVLVLGAGETGMDITYESVISHGLITNLFETAYIHPWVSATRIRSHISDFVVRGLLWVLTGTTAGCNQWAGELPLEKQGRSYVFLNKSSKAMQYINRPFKKLSWIHKSIAHYVDLPSPEGLEETIVKIVPFPLKFDQDGKAIFPPPPKHREKEIAWKEECKPEIVVLCTGYKQEWDWLSDEYPKGPEECDIRGICWSKDLTICFIGFLRPGVGGIPPMAEMQIQLFILLTQGKLPILRGQENYHLLHSSESRIQYGVDYSAYMSTLAKDIGSAPGLFELWREHGWFITFVYCFGAAFPTFYRLQGPFKSSSAPLIVKTEIWETIRRRGLLGNLFMGVIPMIFYAWLNLLVYLAETIYRFLM